MLKTSQLLCVIFALLLGFPDAIAQVGVLPSAGGNLQLATDSKYRVGDVWEYATRGGEERSRLTIVRIEVSSRLGIIIHISTDHLTWRTCQGDPLPEQVPHMPFAREAIEHSITRRVGSSRSLPNYQEGYEE